MDYLEAAIDIVKEELIEIERERKAFVKFRETVRLVDASGSGQVADDLRKSYAETVMTTPHY